MKQLKKLQFLNKSKDLVLSAKREKENKYTSQLKQLGDAAAERVEAVKSFRTALLNAQPVRTDVSFKGGKIKKTKTAKNRRRK
jgi:hypothetical protein